MLFSSATFLFAFLPCVLILYYLLPSKYNNLLLLCASLFFYAWGEVYYIGVLIFSIGINFIIGKGLGELQKEETATIYTPLLLTLGISINLLILLSFKYTNFIADNVNALFTYIEGPHVDIAPIHLPLGISFFTFQAMSYLIDIYRKEVKPQNNLIKLALYISLFPQLIAGPIVRYKDIAQQISMRIHSLEKFSSGVQRFIFGLSKKMLLANPLGETSDIIFSLSSQELTLPLAWIGIIAYTLQIYFDFSGYSDMAIGLGKMFGFDFLENFNYPYISRSLREFWKRWHISLSSWFKDYLYIPLGGNRVAPARIATNLLVVFVLTGIWHGASWNFIIWGLFHGFFITNEHFWFDRTLKKAWIPLQHLYTLLIIISSWVWFRSDSITEALHYFSALIDITHWHTTDLQYAQVISTEKTYCFIIALLLAIPSYTWIKQKLNVISTDNTTLQPACMLFVSKFCWINILLLLCVLKIAASTYNPFIYFRF